MIAISETIDNRTICDLFGVANMGGIRVNKSRNLIVLISNNTDFTYRNEWKKGYLHFVGMGATGPQKLDRQNRTLANASKSGAAIHLFEVFEKSRYVYAGQVELAGEPYMSDQPDVRADNRFVWIFPLRRKPAVEAEVIESDVPPSPGTTHLPHGTYAMVGSDLSTEQVVVVNRHLDQLRQVGILVYDQRDVDGQRYERALVRWHEQVLDEARSIVKGLIAEKRQRAKANRGSTDPVDDESSINSRSNERDLRAALKLLDREDIAATEEIFERARQSVPMPEAPKSLLSAVTVDPIEKIEGPNARREIDRKTLEGFT